ncbi:hypothetical protein COS77_02365, partial [Candidatus Roizmanbacteria bacterium CG06_land_8_20_14_3_00_34_14]
LPFSLPIIRRVYKVFKVYKVYKVINKKNHIFTLRTLRLYDFTDNINLISVPSQYPITYYTW